MPALITHRLFGEESIQKLPANIISTPDERIAFLIANQGPDPLFFRVRTLAAPACMELGHSMHRCRMTRQFEALRTGVDRLPGQDASIGRAFVLGLLSHYVLDRTAHPFVYAQQWGIQAQDETLANAGGQVHGIIEGDLDILMLQLKRDGATVAEFPPADVLEITDRVARVAGALMSYMARSVFDLAVGVTEYGGAVADMKLAYRIIEPAGAPRIRLIGAAEGLIKDYSLLASLAHRVTTEPPRGAGNLDARTWENPFTHELSNEAFPQVFDRALEAYAAAAARFIEGADVAQVTEHLNYSGRPLDEIEEWHEED